MSKPPLVKIFVNNKDLCTKKLNLKDTLSEIRKKIKYENKTNVLFMNENSPINYEDENDFTLEDIIQNKNLYLKGEVLKLYCDNNFIIDIDMAKEESLKKLIEKYSKNFPEDFDFLDNEERTIKKEDAINDDEILIEDILNENRINIITKKNDSIPENNQKNKITNEDKSNVNSEQRIELIFI